jgi:hypothetical protein
MSEEQPKKGRKAESSSNPTSLTLREALTADIGRGDLKEAQEKGYLGYVWVEDNTEFTATNVSEYDQTGPEKRAGVYDEETALNDHYIRGDKLDPDKK